MRLLKTGVIGALFAGVVGVASPASAAYVLTPVESGTTSDSSVSVAPGDAFAVDFVLSSDSGDDHTSIVFQVDFSEAGLLLQSYLWESPYTTGTTFDDSTPNTADKGGGRPQTPTTITESTFTGPASTIDIEMSNVLDSGSFSVGNVVTLNFVLPANWAGASTVTLTAVPDTIADGITPVVTTAGPDFTVNVVPEPGSLAFAGVAAIGLLARRRSRIG